MRKVSFQPPKGVVPEGTADGSDFELVCTFKVEKGGTVCLTQMGDTKMSGYDHKEQPAGKPGYADEASAMQQQMAGGYQ